MELTRGTLSPHTNTLIPTVTDNLFTQNVIPANEVAVSFNPTTREEEVNGELTFGGVDPSKFTGEITFAPISGYLHLNYGAILSLTLQPRQAPLTGIGVSINP